MTHAWARMVIDDPAKFGLLSTQMKLDLIAGARDTLDQMAGLGRKEALKNVREKFTLRNAYTAKQIQFTKAPAGKFMSVTALRSSVGVTEKAAYMARQEEGGKRNPAKGGALAIPTDFARGGARSKPVVKKMYMSRLGRRPVRSARAGDRSFNYQSAKARRVAQAYIAFKTGKGLFFGSGECQNLFAVTQFSKKGKGVAFRLRQAYRLGLTETTTKPTPWLLPAGERVARQAQKIFAVQMDKIMRGKT